MEIILAIVVGILYSAAFYMMMRRSIVKLIIGLGLLGHASNLLIFTLGRLKGGIPPISEPPSLVMPADAADPVPQALILTAIVIGFGVQVFALVLLKRTFQIVGTEDLDALTSTDKVALAS